MYFLKINKLTEYLENRIQLLKLESISATVKINSKIVSSVLGAGSVGDYIIAISFGIVREIVYLVLYMLSIKRN